MKYARILLAMAEERWALQESKLVEILAFLDAKAAGEEIEARITKPDEQAIARKEGAVAILPLRGVIANRMNLLSDFSGGTSSEGFGRAFQAALRDDGVKAIVIDVDSPGGVVAGADELSTMIFNARGQKPIVAHVNARAASAAYWIASAAEELVVTPSGEVGSIGVIGIHEDVSGALEKAGVKRTLISAGKRKTDGHPFAPLADDVRARIQGKIDSAYDVFVRAVARNRGVSLAAVREGFGEGDTVDAQPALAERMVDRVATLEETLQRFGASLYSPLASKRRAFAPNREARALDF